MNIQRGMAQHTLKQNETNVDTHATHKMYTRNIYTTFR